MLRLLKVLMAVAMVGLIPSMLWPAVASAHESRKLGKYQLVVGFIAEPAVEGVKNGVELRVTNTENNQPVEGLEKTLKVEVAHKGISKVMDLRAIFRDPGHYTADLIPTAPGQYAFRFFGTIEGLQVNERFESGPGRFNDVGSSGELQFPERLPEIREIAGVVPAVQKAAMEAQDSASSARTLALVAIAVGTLGVLSGVLSMAVALSKR